MDFEFDPRKDDLNAGKHGIRFRTAQQLWISPGVEVDFGMVNGEERHGRLAAFEDEIWLAVFTLRHGAIRLISVRRASTNEIRIYETHRDK